MAKLLVVWETIEDYLYDTNFMLFMSLIKLFIIFSFILHGTQTTIRKFKSSFLRIIKKCTIDNFNAKFTHPSQRIHRSLYHTWAHRTSAVSCMFYYIGTLESGGNAYGSDGTSSWIAEDGLDDLGTSLQSRYVQLYMHAGCQCCQRCRC